MAGKIEGIFELSLNEDGRHATLRLSFPEMNDEIKAWLRFTYCNDLIWQHHCGNLGAAGGVEYFSTVRMDLYRHLLKHVNREQWNVYDPPKDLK